MSNNIAQMSARLKLCLITNYSWNILARPGLSPISQGEIMTFHIASALKSAAVTAGTVLWIGTAAAAPFAPVPDQFRAIIVDARSGRA